MKMKKLKRLFAGLMTAAMVMSTMAMTAFAEDPQLTAATIDTTKTGSITIHKYEYNGTTTENRTGTGTTADAAKVPADATALNGVTFELYQVMTKDQMLEYYNGTDGNAVTVDTFVSGTSGNYTVTDKDRNIVTEKKTDITTGEGLASFTGLTLGMYVVIEASAPDKVTSPADPFLVSVPMTNTDKTNWLYDINVYPKNSTSEGTVELTKKDEKGNALSGVTFKLEKQSGATWSVVENELTTDSNGKIKCDSLAHGTYRITETSAPAGYIVDQKPIVFTVSENNTITCEDSRACINLNNSSGNKVLNITLINEKPDLTKEIDEGVQTTHEANAAIGSTVNYKITVNVPKNITDMKTFVVTDTPTNLKDNIGTIQIVDDTNNTVPTNGIYTVQESEKGFIITFIPSGMSTYAGKQLTITYSATVLADAVTDGKAPNTAELTYSNKIHADSSTQDGEGDKNHIKDEAIVYNYQIKIIKYKDSINTGNELADVEFELYKADSSTPVSVVEIANGVYRLAVAEDTNTTTTLVTGENGQLVVKGLTDGTYYLKETKTANGYNLLKDKVEVTLNLDTITTWDESSEFVQNTTTGAWDLVKKSYMSTTYTAGENDAEDNYVSQNIINKKGFELPTTGGFGTILFSLIGILLMAGGAVVLFRANKKKSA